MTKKVRKCSLNIFCALFRTPSDVINILSISVGFAPTALSATSDGSKSNHPNTAADESAMIWVAFARRNVQALSFEGIGAESQPRGILAIAFSSNHLDPFPSHQHVFGPLTLTNAHLFFNTKFPFALSAPLCPLSARPLSLASQVWRVAAPPRMRACSCASVGWSMISRAHWMWRSFRGR